jgi:hypothetical protein
VKHSRRHARGPRKKFWQTAFRKPVNAIARENVAFCDNYANPGGLTFLAAGREMKKPRRGSDAAEALMSARASEARGT